MNKCYVWVIILSFNVFNSNANCSYVWGTLFLTKWGQSLPPHLTSQLHFLRLSCDAVSITIFSFTRVRKIWAIIFQVLKIGDVVLTRLASSLQEFWVEVGNSSIDWYDPCRSCRTLCFLLLFLSLTICLSSNIRFTGTLKVLIDILYYFFVFLLLINLDWYFFYICWFNRCYRHH